MSTAGRASVPVFILGLAATLGTSAVTAYTAKTIEKNSVATLRRAVAVTVAGQAIWFILMLVGVLLTSARPGGRPLDNSVLFGGFVCAGFEFVIVYGAFMRSASASVGVSALFPALFLASILPANGLGSADAYAFVSGLASYAILVSFPFLLGREKTSLGYGSLRLFRAFIKTWSTQNATELEQIIKAHSETAVPSTKVLRFDHGGGSLFVILPGIHPGPFFPVGSYNFPELLNTKFQGVGSVMALHRPGGHERNLATQADADKYASRIFEFARGVRVGIGKAKIRGPVLSKAGGANVAAFAIEDEMVVTASFAPRGSDDLEASVEEDLSKQARSRGFNLSMVDAHNSITPMTERLDTTDPHWAALMDNLTDSREEDLKVGFAHSDEIHFEHGRDVTKCGIGLLFIHTKGAKWVLVLADANNAVPSLREATSEALSKSGFRLLEFCTSDSHDLAARGLTVDRGYQALGEVTSVDKISEAVVSLASLSETRETQCAFGSGTFSGEAPIFGSSALDEFARLTQDSSRLARRYTLFAVVSVAALTLASALL